jgi:hypothetical protein
MKKILLTLIVILSVHSINAQEIYFGSRQDKGVISDSLLTELSGIDDSRMNPDILWMHNDEGNRNEIYALDKRGRMRAIVRFDSLHFTDPEDISVAIDSRDEKSYIYIADVGDNDATRDYAVIYKVPEPMVAALSESVQVININQTESLKFNYPDGSRDCEAMLYDETDNTIYVISKREKNARVYSLDWITTSTAVTAEYICELPYGNEGFGASGVTGADMSIDGSEVLVRQYGKVHYYVKNSGESIKDVLSATPLQTPYIPEPQGEAVCFDNVTDGFYTVSERSPLNIIPHLYFYPKLKTDVNDSGSNKSAEPDSEQQLFSISGLRFFDVSDLTAMPQGLYFKISRTGMKTTAEKILLIK